MKESDNAVLDAPEQSIDDVHVNAVHSLHLAHFRNYRDVEIQTTAKCVLLQGHNGAGKTNVLEAISLLSPGRGLRKAKLREMNHLGGEQGWVIAAHVQGHEGELHIGTGLDVTSETDKRIVKVDGDKPKGQAELAKHLSVIWQTPQMDGLFTDSNSARRSFLDRLVYAFDVSHLTRVNHYEHAMRERNKLLQTPPYDVQWIEVLEQKMAEQAVAIAVARNALIDRLNHTIMQSATGFPKAHLNCDGEVEQRAREGVAAVDIEEEVKRMLAENRAVDARAGRALRGVHRSVLQVHHIMKNMEAAYCSTGEQKAMLLTILLAHARAKSQWIGSSPILLLDEVVAHLDAERRRELFAEIADIGVQAWLTGTDVADFSDMPSEADIFEVKNSQISAL